jgi:hypothetical protein
MFKGRDPPDVHGESFDLPLARHELMHRRAEKDGLKSNEKKDIFNKNVNVDVAREDQTTFDDDIRPIKEQINSVANEEYSTQHSDNLYEFITSILHDNKLNETLLTLQQELQKKSGTLEGLDQAFPSTYRTYLEIVQYNKQLEEKIAALKSQVDYESKIRRYFLFFYF